jgi:hypothetical protein
LLPFLLLAVTLQTASAAVEQVLVVKVFQDSDKGIIQRANGEKWLIEKGTGAISFWRYEGKKALINSPGLFCGVGSSIILPDVEQQARIWKAEQLDASNTKQPTDAQLAGIALIQLGYFDPENPANGKTDPVAALKAFQKAKKLESTGKLSSETQLALAREVNAKLPATQLRTNLAVALVVSSKALAGQAGGASGADGKETGIGSVTSDGSVVKLADGSIYEIDAIARIKTMLWLPNQRVVRYQDAILHLGKGQKVKATLLKD